MKNAPDITGKYLPQLDGVRGLAILLVISFHYVGFLKIFSFGWVGVDLFFVLSGYLITSRLYATKNQDNYFLKFYRNRILRIFPVYFGTLIAFYTGFNSLLSAENLPSFNYYNNYWWSFALFIENWTFIIEMPVQDHLLHFWSLAIEEQFYLVWPLFLFLSINRKYILNILLIAIVVIIGARSAIYFQHPSFKESPYYFYNTFCRMDGFIAGGGLFLLQQKASLKRFQNWFWLLPIAIGTGIYFTDTTQANSFISTIGYTLLALFFAGIINYITINPGSTVSVIFSAKWIRFIGKISYGLYIYHWIIYRVLQARFEFWLKDIVQQPAFVTWISLFICLTISLLISIVSYTYFEVYFLKLKKR